MPDIKTALQKAFSDAERRVELASMLDAWEAHEKRIRQPQEKAMPTLKEAAVDTAIVEDQRVAHPNAAFAPTGNISMDTFNYIRSGVYNTRKVIEDLHAKYGYKESTVTSLIAQMHRCGMLARSGQTVSPIVDRYKPIPTPPPKKAKVRVFAKVAPAKKPVIMAAPAPQSTSNGIAALADTANATPATTVKPLWDADTVIENIGIKEAHKLYKQLHEYFGR